jgi:hypothetical protein
MVRAMIRHLRVALLCAAALGGCLAAAPSALAHIDMISPVPRAHGFPDTNLSRRPCGQRNDERVADAVSVFRPGQTIDVVWDVYVQHVSYFRIAFDAHGDDSFSSRPSMPSDPAADDPTILAAGEGETILAYVEDRNADIDHVEQEVTLPDVPCADCTLQVIQFTYGLPIENATYHQCADLVLEGAPAGAPASGAAAEAGAPVADGCTLSRAGVTSGALAWLSLPVAVALSRRRLGRAQRSASDSIHRPSSST